MKSNSLCAAIEVATALEKMELASYLLHEFGLLGETLEDGSKLDVMDMVQAMDRFAAGEDQSE